jgi:DNA-binding MltR family transcriptional regulator
MDMRGWRVYLNRRLIDIVFYRSKYSAEYVKESLIEHDGYNPDIHVMLDRAI